MSKTWAKLAGTARLPFLLLTPACLLPAIATTLRCCPPPDAGRIWLIFCCALAAHISVNSLNEYWDFRSGLDQNTTRTPFSGGSGTLPAHPELAPGALWLGVFSLMLTVVTGSYLVYTTGVALLPIGLAGLMLVAFYSTWIVKHPLLCLLSAGLGFGPLMVAGAGIALSGQLTADTVWASIIIGCAVNNLLLLNQVPDRQADAAAGRRTLPVVASNKTVLRIYLMFTVLGLGALATAVARGALPPLSLLAALPLCAGFWSARGMRIAGDDIRAMTPYLAINVAISLAVPVLLAAGLYLH